MNIVWYDKNLTKKQVELYVAIKEYIENYRYSPSIRDLCEILDGKSTGTILPGLRLLRKKGYINFLDGKSRTITILKEVKYERD